MDLVEDNNVTPEKSTWRSLILIPHAYIAFHIGLDSDGLVNVCYTSQKLLSLII